MARFFHLTVGLFAALFAVAALAVGGVAWQIASVSGDSKSFTPYVEQGLSWFVPGLRPAIGETEILWDNRKHILEAKVSQLRFYDAGGAEVVSVPAANLKLRLWSLLRLRFLPLELTAQNVRLQLVRRADGAVVFGSGDQGTGDANALDIVTEIGAELGNANLRHHIAINEIKADFHDAAGKANGAVVLRDLALDHEGAGATGSAKLEASLDGGAPASLEGRYAYDPSVHRHRLALTFAEVRPSSFAGQSAALADLAAVDVPLSGKIALEADRSLDLSLVDIALQAGAGALREPRLWSEPRAVKSMALEARYEASSGRGELVRAEADFGGPKLAAKGKLKMPVGPVLLRVRGASRASFDLTAHVEDLGMDSFSKIWPMPAVPGARDWIAANLSKGSFTSADVEAKGSLEVKDLENATIESVEGRVMARRGRVSYIAGMPPVEGVDADAKFDLDHMEVKILSGGIGDIRLDPFTIRLTDFQKSVQYADIPLQIKGPAPAILKLIDAPPLGYAKAVGLSPEGASGQVEGTVKLRLPLLSDLPLKDVEIGASAKFKDLGLRGLVKGFDISQGQLAFALDKDGFKLEGPILLNKAPLQLVWKNSFALEGTAQTPVQDGTLSGSLKAEAWESLGLAPEIVRLKGETPVTVRYVAQRKGAATLSGDVNLKSAALRAPAIGWAKPAGASARLSFAVDLQDGQKTLRVKTIDLQGQGVRVKGNATLDSESGALRSLSLSPFILGRSNAKIGYSAPADLAAPEILTVTGEELDLGGLEEEGPKEEKKKEETKKEEPPSARPRAYDIRLARLSMSKTGFLSTVALKAKRDDVGWNLLDFKALAQGRVPVAASLQPEGAGGLLHLAISSSDFGAMLEGFGLGTAAEGGELSIDGRASSEAPREIKGKIKISSFTVKDWPFVARLFSALSPFGFADLITGEASFESVRGDFGWKGDEIALHKLRAAGSVVGLNMDGHVNLATGALNFNGMAVPFSFMNSLIGSIPLLGDVITGGDGQGILAVAFSVKGTTSQPDIGVNPGSLLTPGILRNLFFSNEEGEEKDKKP